MSEPQKVWKIECAGEGAVLVVAPSMEAALKKWREFMEEDTEVSYADDNPSSVIDISEDDPVVV